MYITIISVGKWKKHPLLAGFNEYLKRLSWKCTLIEIESKSTLPEDKRKKDEADKILKALKNDSYVLLLDEKGSALTSVEFSKLLSQQSAKGNSHIACIIGGADGVDASIHERANQTISFGKLTWPHMLVRVMLIEQLYRASLIASGHPYHREG